MSNSVLSIIFLLFGISGSAPAADEKGSLRLDVVDSFGKPILQVTRAILTDVYTRRTIQSASNSSKQLLAIENVRSGIYELRVESPGFESTRTIIRFSPADSKWLRIGLALGATHSAIKRPTITGAVPAYFGSINLLWIKLQCLYTNALNESEVTVTRTFHFEGLNAGVYVVMLMNGNHVLTSKSISLLTDSEVGFQCVSSPAPPN